MDQFEHIFNFIEIRMPEKYIEPLEEIKTAIAEKIKELGMERASIEEILSYTTAIVSLTLNELLEARDEDALIKIEEILKGLVRKRAS